MTATDLKSAIYVGRVEHRRFAPIEHAFAYRHFQLCLELSELERLFDGRWLWSHERANLASLRRADYLGREGSLDGAVRACVKRELGREPDGSIYLLTQPRLVGFVFNPVSFYYCERADGSLDAIVAEITNTPWRERHAYVLDARDAGSDVNARFAKQFHVSPFMEMDVEYRWRFSRLGERLDVHMLNVRDGEPLFESTLALERREWSGAELAKLLVSFPGFSARSIAAIYWQALRLKLKGAPFFEHPKWKSARAGSSMS